MGMFGLESLDWDGEALSLAGIDAAQLPVPVPTTTVLPGLRASIAERVGIDAATPLVVGAGDGPLANLGVGAVRPGVAACSIGTSGAVRVTVAHPHVDDAGRLFCSVLTGERWVAGGAINNGGVVLRWVAEALAPDLGAHAESELLALAERAPAGSGGLLMLPHLYAERAPPGAPGRAAPTSASPTRTDARTWCAPRRGASRLVALGRLDGLDTAGSGVGVDEVRTPDPQATAVYAELRPVFESAIETLTPVFEVLRRMEAGGPSRIAGLTTPAPPPSPSATSGSPGSVPRRRRGGRRRSR
jgi:hypothetical protein